MTDNVIKFLDLNVQYKAIRQEILTAIENTLDSGTYVLGRNVEVFENDFARLHDCHSAVAVNSGTSALHLALLCCGVRPGDEVITTGMSFTATAAAIMYCGAKPVFVDVDPGTATLDPSNLTQAITNKTKAIVPVHLYGLPCEMAGIMKIAEDHRLKVVEDCAQAHLATFNGRKVGSFGNFGCFSFYPGKNLGAYGEGGLITSNDAAGIEELKMLRDWGQKKKYYHEKLGYNYRMDAIQGAVLNVKLKYLKKWTDSRREKARKYQEFFRNTDIKTQIYSEKYEHSYHIFSVFIDERDQVSRKLNDSNVQTGLHYPIPMHLQECYNHLGYKPGSLVHSEELSARQLSLPLYPELPDDELSRVAERIYSLVDKK